MPKTIPYDPSLVLGDVVDRDRLNELLDLAKDHEQEENAKAELDELTNLLNSLEIARSQLLDQGVSTEEIEAEIKNIRDVLE